MEVLTFAKELIITAFVGHIGPFELSSLVLAQVTGMMDTSRQHR
jgi:MATE family multidrug resistance protein